MTSQDPQKPGPDETRTWIEKLADRSTGLPQEDKGEAPAAPDPDAPNLWRLAGLGLQFGATVALFAWFGYLLDDYMHWHGAALITLTLLAVIGNLWLLIKETQKFNK